MEPILQWMIAVAVMVWSINSVVASVARDRQLRQALGTLATMAQRLHEQPESPFDTSAPYDAATMRRVEDMLAGMDHPAERNAQATEFEVNKYGASRLGPEAAEIAGRVGPGGGRAA